MGSAAGECPKYSLLEIERRWLVAPHVLSILEGQPHYQIKDLYVDGTELRLRRISDLNGEAVFKLCKKYGKASSLSQPITNLYLSEEEYQTLAQLGGKVVRKRRYAVAGGSVDVYDGTPVISVFEVEFGTEEEAERYEPPSFVSEEITHDESYTGAALSLRGAL
jgi:CYTH domain-containing protein